MSVFTPRDLKLFDVARSLAATSTHYKANIGAVIVDRKEIVSVGVNGKKTHPLQRKYNFLKTGKKEDRRHFMHAELDAIIKARGQDLSDASIYVYRLMRDGSLGMCRPCAGCLAALRDFNLSSVYYTTTEGLAFEEMQHT